MVQIAMAGTQPDASAVWGLLSPAARTRFLALQPHGSGFAGFGSAGFAPHLQQVFFTVTVERDVQQHRAGANATARIRQKLMTDFATMALYA
jgi:hypothetical protein